MIDALVMLEYKKMKPKNELTIINKIVNKLQEKREPTIFPLSPTHRKELRKLKNDNIGNLTLQLRTIKTLKTEEYQKKYSKQIEKEIQKHVKTVEILNKDWEYRLAIINTTLKGRKEFEYKHNLTYLYLSHDFTRLTQLEECIGKRKFDINIKDKVLEIATNEFNKKYNDKFMIVQKEIEKITIHYEEAINFGDLEIVKQLYYLMKSSNHFFEKIEKLKI